ADPARKSREPVLESPAWTTCPAAFSLHVQTNGSSSVFLLRCGRACCRHSITPCAPRCTPESVHPRGVRIHGLSARSRPTRHARRTRSGRTPVPRSEEHTSELQSREKL